MAARSGHGRCRRPDASVMRPASHKLNSRLPMVEMPEAAGSSASATAVASSISCRPERRRVRHLRQLVVDERLQHVAQRRAQRLDVAAEQEQRQRREDAGQNGGGDDEAAGRIPLDAAVGVGAVERGEIDEDDDGDRLARRKNERAACGAAGNEHERGAGKAGDGGGQRAERRARRGTAPAASKGKGACAISSGPVVAEANTTAETSPAPSPMSRRYGIKTAVPRYRG